VLAIITSTKSLGLSQNISCKLHGKKYLVVDTLSFKLMCKICSDSNGNKTEKNNITTDEAMNSNLEITNIDNSSEEEHDDIECDLHPNLKGSFYCDDCKIFLCKSCFSKEHRLHNSNLPEEIAKSFKYSLGEFSNTIFSLEPKIINSIKTISDLEAKIIAIRESSIKRIEDIKINIKNLSNKKAEMFFEEYKNSMQNVDTDTNNVLLRLDALNKKIINTLEELINYKNRVNEVNKSNNNNYFYDFCEKKKQKKELFKQAKKIFYDSKTLINYIFDDIVKIAKKKISEFDFLIQMFNKKLNLYRNSVINSLQRGISSFSFKIKRFTKFSKAGIKYFKCSSLIFKSYSAISVVGLSVCGLVKRIIKSEISFKENKNNINNSYNPHTNHIPTLIDNHTNRNLASSKIDDVESSLKDRARLPIKIILKESLSDDYLKYEKIFEEDFLLFDILNPFDPTNTFYLKKSINIKPERLYIISVINLDKETYVEIWNGEVPKIFQKEESQSIECNTNHLKFTFNIAEGIESDFSEFDSGIIADVLYSYKDN